MLPDRHPAAAVSVRERVEGVPEPVVGIDEVEPFVIMYSTDVVLDLMWEVETMRMSCER